MSPAQKRNNIIICQSIYQEQYCCSRISGAKSSLARHARQNVTTVDTPPSVTRDINGRCSLIFRLTCCFTHFKWWVGIWTSCTISPQKRHKRHFPRACDAHKHPRACAIDVGIILALFNTSVVHNVVFEWNVRRKLGKTSVFPYRIIEEKERMVRNFFSLPIENAWFPFNRSVVASTFA